jgi:hypothetical protein
VSGDLDLGAAERAREEERDAVKLVLDLRAAGVLDDVSLRPSELPVALTAAQALALGGLLGRFHRSVGWWLGDLILYCKARWGEGVAGQIEAVTGLHPETLADYERTAEAMPPRQRVAVLSFRHHRAVKRLAPADRRAWLERAVNQKWSSDKLRVELAAERARRERTEKPSTEPQKPPETVIEVARLISNVVMPSVGNCYCLPGDLLARLRRALGEAE